jgi:tRNA G10  N-methylase Trm11
VNKYILILGQSTDLARQEATNWLGSSPNKILETGSNFLIIESESKAKEIMKNLGGTIKVARLLDKLKSLEDLASFWIKNIPLSNEQKTNFGFSLYDGSHKEYSIIQSIALDIKRELKSKHKIRLVSSREEQLSSVIVTKNKLIGSELVVIKKDEQWILGITEAVQDFAKYGLRDMKRPNRDDKSGMLPPKLAQMMLNLAGSERNKTILDPFCGSGTVLQEAMLLGFEKIYGTDVSDKAVNDAIANTDWLIKTFNLKIKPKINKINIKSISRSFSNEYFDLIVSEPYMGDARFIQRQKSVAHLDKIRNELQELYNDAFEQFKKILKKSGKIVFIFPIFDIHDKQLHTLDKQIIQNLGFELVGKPLIYHRPNQKVHREITIWKIK